MKRRNTVKSRDCSRKRVHPGDGWRLTILGLGLGARCVYIRMYKPTNRRVPSCRSYGIPVRGQIRQRSVRRWIQFCTSVRLTMTLHITLQNRQAWILSFFKIVILWCTKRSIMDIHYVLTQVAPWGHVWSRMDLGTGPGTVPHYRR